MSALRRTSLSPPDPPRAKFAKLSTTDIKDSPSFPRQPSRRTQQLIPTSSHIQPSKMDINNSFKPRHLSRYVADKLRDGYYECNRPATPQYHPTKSSTSLHSPRSGTSRIRSKSKSKSKAKFHPADSLATSIHPPNPKPSAQPITKTSHRPASTTLGYNPFARYHSDDAVDYQIYHSYNTHTREHPADFSRTIDYDNGVTVPRLRVWEEEERIRAKMAERRRREEDREVRRQMREFEAREKAKGKGKRAVRDEDEDGDVDWEVEDEDEEMLDVV